MRATSSLVVLAALLVGCPCSVHDLDRAFEEDWEDCDGLCGWELVEGQAVVVETFHSSEHALQFEGPRTTIRHRVEPRFPTCADEPCEMQLSVVTNCRSGLTAEALYYDAYGAEEARVVGFDCTSSGGSLQYCQSTVRLGVADGDGRITALLGALRFQSTRSECVVDDILLQSFYMFCGA